MSGEPGDVPQLPAQLLANIYAHARRTYPSECCGYVLGSGDAAELVVCENFQDRYHAVDPETFPRTSTTAYTFGPKDLRRLAASFDADVPATIVYHSHPDVGAYFSAEDARAATSAGWPVDYLVVDCQADRIGGAVLFRRRETAGEPEYVEVARYQG
jgi:proteasome lid subunit RPN8/RPN11